MNKTLTVGPDTVVRKSCETACDDHDVILDAGTYPVRYVAIGGGEVAPEKAYWVVASIPCARVGNGSRFGKAGDRGAYVYQTWTYAFTGTVTGRRAAVQS